MGDIGFGELILIGIIAILLYGKDLPQVARKLAHYYNKIRRHLNSIKDEIARQIPDESISLDSPSSPPSYSSDSAPPPPTGLTATLEENQVMLSWDFNPQAEYYNLKRSTPPEGSYATIATGLSSTTYTDCPSFDGSTISYVVTATNSSGESGDSMEATVYLPSSAAPAAEAPTPPAPAAEAAPPAEIPTEDTGNGPPEAAAAPPAPPPAEPEVPRMS